MLLYGDKMKALDITQSLENNHPYPVDGLEKPKITPVFGLDEGAPVNVTALHYTQHFGTHVDTPRHVIPGGKCILDYPIARFMGRAQVIQVNETGEIPLEHLVGRLDPTVNMLLLKTRNGLSPQFDENHAYLSRELAEYLVKRKYTLIGMDTPSPDKFGGSLDNHCTLLSNDVLIVENLDLSGIANGSYDFIGLPLALNAEASPIRAILLEPRKCL